MTTASEIESHLASLLEVGRFKDYGPNGLQVEGPCRGAPRGQRRDREPGADRGFGEEAHHARETGVTFIACGHHASERFGAPAVGDHLAQRFGIEHRFIEIDNRA